MPKPKQLPVCINVLPSFSRIELVQYDPEAGAFMALDSEEFLFDLSTREMVYDQENFKMIIKRMYERNRIALKTPTTVVLPSFYTRQYTLPEDVNAPDEIEAVLLSEVERFYVFKKVDPKIGFVGLKEKQVLYTAYPLLALQAMEEVFAQLKVPVMAVDNNYIAILRGLVAMGLIEQEIAQSVKWSLVVVSDYCLFLAIVEGMTIEKTMETPLTVQEVDEMTLTAEIGGDFKQFCGFEVLNKIVVINNSDKIYSKALLDVLEFKGPTDVFDQNERTLSSIGHQEAPFPCSLEAIGGTLLRYVPQVAPLNIASPMSSLIGVDAAQQNIIAGAILALGLVILLFQTGISFLMDMLAGQETQAATQISIEMDKEINSQAIVPEVKQRMYVQKGLEQNYRFSNILIKMAQALPPDAWLTSIKVNANTDFKVFDVEISGGAMTSDPLNTYVNELNALLLPNQKFTPTIAPQMKDDTRYFEFKLALPKDATGGIVSSQSLLAPALPGTAGGP